MRNLLTSLLLITFVAACTDNTIDETSNQNPKPTMAVTDEGVIKANQMNSLGIGDVESQMILSVVLDVSSYSSTVVHREEENKRKRIARAIAVVTAPYPETLNVLVYNSNTENYPGHAYRTTVSLYVGKDLADAKVVDTYAYITGKSAKNNVQSKIVNILPFLNAASGEEFEVHARAEIEFFENTDDSTLTLESPATSSVTTATKMSNPLDIIFK